MKLEIYGWDILKKHFPDISFSKNKLRDILKKEFSPFEVNDVNVIFTTKKQIQELNKEFREKDSPTDVLSFEIEEEPLEGEIYVCPEYVGEGDGEKEVVRLIVHGFLHVVGYEHEGYFKEDSNEQEKMFVKQEEVLENIYNNLNS
jgi:probable rRNA maturation factor